MKRLLALCTAVALAVTGLSLGVFADDDDVKPTSIRIEYQGRSVTNQTITVTRGNTIWLDYTIRPDDANVDLDVDWESSNSDVADVDNGGNVTANEPGVTTIRVRTNNRKSASVTIRVPGKASPENDDPDNADTWGVRDSDSSSEDDTLEAVELSGPVSTETLLESLRKSGSKNATITNASSVSTDSLKAAAKASSSSVNFDTRSGGKLVGRVVIRPSNAAKLSGNVGTGVYCGTEETYKVQNKFDLHYSNTQKVILCDQKDYKMNVVIVANVGMKMNDRNLVFYSYNPDRNSVTPVNMEDVRIDANGFLYFTTTTGGYIVVSDGLLTK